MALITLTTDIGQQDFMIGAIKGQLLQEMPGVPIVDITHNLSAFNLPQAAYLCRNAIFNFPAGTTHLILVNVFDEKSTGLLAAKHRDHHVCCADNGLITMLLEGIPEQVATLPVDSAEPKTLLNLTRRFAKAMARIQSGEAIGAIGDVGAPIQIKNALRPNTGPNWMEGQIIFVDQFENVVVNISRQEFEEQRKGRGFKIVFRRDEVIDKISDNYADVEEGDKLALFNSAGHLEIAINKGNAAGLFGLRGFNEKQAGVLNQQKNIQLFYQSIKIFFD
jgi:S-adenosylmethionine hydrolase